MEKIKLKPGKWRRRDGVVVLIHALNPSDYAHTEKGKYTFRSTGVDGSYGLYKV